MVLIMKYFDVYTVFLGQYMLLFLSICIGLYFGKLKIGRFKFGIAGTLVIGLIIGWATYEFSLSQEEGSAAYVQAQKLIKDGVVSNLFFDMFLIIFVCSVGLLASKEIAIIFRQYGMKFMILGLIITFVGAVVTYGMATFSKNTNPFEVTGVYTGALTSSPGLAAAIESARSYSIEKSLNYEELSSVEKSKYLKFAGIKEEVDVEKFQITNEIKEQYVRNAEAGVGAGHAIGYPFGVLVVILAMNFIPLLFKIDIDEEKRLLKEEMVQASIALNSKKAVKFVEEKKFDMAAFMIACSLGYIVGSINLFLPFIGKFSLGSTGGILIVALVLGSIGKIGNISFRMDTKVLNVLKDFSLAFFLAVVGLRYGYNTVDSLYGSGAYLALVTLVVGFSAILVGFIVGRYVFKIKWPMLAGAICGGMTSAPGMGAAIDALECDEPAAGYGAAYPMALLGMVIFSIIIHKLPI
jgi:putative transport protein